MPTQPQNSAVSRIAGFPVSLGRGHVDLFLISFVGLFLELACIRWFGSTVIFLTFFTNLVLMACFLGISVGSMAAKRSRAYIETTVPLCLGTMVLAFLFLWAYSQFTSVLVDVGSQSSPEQIYFGSEFRHRNLSSFVIPLEVIAGIFFVLISLVFLGIGQSIGRAFDAIPDHIEAYAVNLLGSLAGIVSFGLLSLLRAPPSVWFAIGFGLILPFVKRPVLRWLSVISTVAAVAGLILTAELPVLEVETVATTTWSPYYKVRYEPATAKVYVNNIMHQKMVDLSREGLLYRVPYLVSQNAGVSPYQDVLIIGAGSGNDVVAALEQGAKSVDAVEIDPVLNRIGRDHHPNKPYADPRVTAHIDDGRSFVRSTKKKYDMIIYALVDSLVLQSGYSSVRLESFLFTDQAFRDLKERLKPGGVLVLYNLYRQGWVVGRLAGLVERTFRTAPVVLSLPYQEAITPADNQEGKLTFVMSGVQDNASLESIRRKFKEQKFLFVNQNSKVGTGKSAPVSGAGASDMWFPLGPASVQTQGVGQLPSDDAPFLYLRDPMIPGLNIRGMAIVAVFSLLILFTFAPVRTARPNGQMFFLGAGFMLLETKGVVHLALLFGATWMVNSIVFAAILVMALLSALYVRVYQPRKIWPYYTLLIAALGLNLAVPVTAFLDLPFAVRAAVSCLVVFIPVFFGGVVFSTSFRDSRQPDVDFGSNVGGAILGGLCENLSLIVGFSNLLLVAGAFYLLSALFVRRRS